MSGKRFVVILDPVDASFKYEVIEEGKEPDQDWVELAPTEENVEALLKCAIDLKYYMKHGR